MEYRKKMLTILFFISVIYLTYRVYRNEIYVWFCDNEENQGACTVAGLLYKEQHDVANATIYLQKACDLNYSQGCFHLGILYKENSQADKSLPNLEKACKLNYGPACDMLQ